jgi:hypothetical protein
MTLQEAFDIISARRREAFRAAGYVQPEEARFTSEVDVIQSHATFRDFLRLGGHFVQTRPTEDALAGLITMVLRFGVDVGKLLQQSANAGEAQPTHDSRAERQRKQGTEV